jgi:small GTP-binding protein
LVEKESKGPAWVKVTKEEVEPKDEDTDDIPELTVSPVDKMDIIKKICVIGDSGVGKKTILGKIAPFRKDWERYTETIGTAITKYTLGYSLVTADINLLIIIWDVTGKADYQRMQPSYYKGAEALVVMADANDQGSIDNIPNWIKAAYKITGIIPTIVVINKVDLIPEDHRKPLDRYVRSIMGQHEVPIFYTTKDQTEESLKLPFATIAEMLGERVKAQLAKRRLRKQKQQQQ